MFILIVYSVLTRIYQSSKYTEKTAESDVVVVEFQKEAFVLDQTASNAVNLIFSQKADVKIADVTINKFIAVGNGTEKVPMVVSNVIMSDDKKTAAVSVFSNFENNTTYEISVKGYDDVATFNPVIGAPVSMTISSKSYLGGSLVLTGDAGTELTYTLWDANGTDVTNTVFGDIEYSAADVTTSDYYVDDKYIYVYTNGAQATVNAVFHTYEYDDAAKEKTFTASGVFVGVDKAIESVASVNMWLEKWSNGFSGNKVPVNLGDDGNLVEVKLKLKTTAWGDWDRPYNNGDEVGLLAAGNKVPFVRFRSTNPDVLDIVDHNSNAVNLFKQGTTAILLELVTLNDDGSETVNTVAAINVTVADACKVSNIAFPAGASLVVGTDDDFDVEQLQIVAKDQYGFEWGMVGWNDTVVDDKNTAATDDDETVAAAFGKVSFADGYVISQNNQRGSVYLSPRRGQTNWQDKIVVDGNMLLADMVDAEYLELVPVYDEDDNLVDIEWKVGTRKVTSISKRIVIEGQANTPGGAKSDVKFTFNVTLKKPVGTAKIDVEAGNVAGGNVGRYATNDGHGYTEGLKTLEFKVFTKKNDVKTEQMTLVGKMPSDKQVDDRYATSSAVATPTLFYTLTRDGKDLTDLLGGDAVKYDAATGTVSVNYTSLADIPGGNKAIIYKAAVPGSDNPSTAEYDPKYIDLGAGNYVFTLYKVAYNQGANKYYYAFVDSANAKTTVDIGKYTLVRRTVETITDDMTIRDCFEIKDRDGNDAGTFCDYNIKETDEYIHVYSITFYEYVTNENGTNIFAAYTVDINVSLKK